MMKRSEFEVSLLKAIRPVFIKYKEQSGHMAAKKAALEIFTHPFSMYVEELGDPSQSNWKYNLELNHIENIRIYKRVFQCDLKRAKEVCDQISLEQMDSKEIVEYLEQYEERV